MRIDLWETTEIKHASIGSIRITEKINKVTTDEGTIVRYSTSFYNECIKFYEAPFPMITNKSLNRIKTESELKKILK